MDEQTVICEVDTTALELIVTTIQQQLLTTNELLTELLNSSIYHFGVVVALFTFLVASMLIVMVSVWRRSS